MRLLMVVNMVPQMRVENVTPLRQAIRFDKAAENLFQDHQESRYDTSMNTPSREELDAKLAANKAEVEARLANFDTSIKTGFAELRAEMAKQTAEMHKGTADLIKWAIGLGIAIVGTTVGILTFVINNVIPKSPVQTAAQPAPIIITVPAAGSAAPGGSPPTPSPLPKP